MPYGLYVSAEGAQAQARRMETIANNLANVDTPGFKRDMAVFQSRYTEAINQGTDSPGSGTINDLSGGIEVLKTMTEFTRGPLKHTGVPTDMAIDGDGFFLVQRGDQSYLTRAGNFLLTPSGSLVTQAGDPVLDPAGTPVQIEPEQPWQLTPDGSIQQAGSATPLAMVRPESLQDLVKVGDNLFFATGNTTALDPSDRHVASGHLEASGVRPTLEMMEMIETSRAFEANVQLIRNHDNLIGTLISGLLQ